MTFEGPSPAHLPPWKVAPEGGSTREPSYRRISTPPGPTLLGTPAAANSEDDTNRLRGSSGRSCTRNVKGEWFDVGSSAFQRDMSDGITTSVPLIGPTSLSWRK